MILDFISGKQRGLSIESNGQTQSHAENTNHQDQFSTEFVRKRYILRRLNHDRQLCRTDQ